MDLDRFNKAYSAKSLTDTKLGRQLGLTRQSVYYYRTGKSVPPLEVVEKIAGVLEVPVLWLLGYDEPGKELASYFNKLDDTGKRKVMDYAKDMSMIYKKE